jgi:hypothetical protein
LPMNLGALRHERLLYQCRDLAIAGRKKSSAV